MKKSRHNRTVVRIVASLVAAMQISACGNNPKAGEGNDSRHQYVPERNEVEVMRLGYGPFIKQLISNGKLSAHSKSTLSFRTSGVIKSVNYSNGETVNSGNVISELCADTQEMAYQSARIALRKAEFDLYDVLAGQGYTAKDTLSVPKELLAMAKMRSGYDAAEIALVKAEYDLEATRLRAPFTGRMADIKSRPYDNSGAEAFCTILDDSMMYVDFSVLESEYAFLENGLNVNVIPYSDQTQRVTGQIVSINPKVDKNGQISVRAGIRNNGSLIDGMNVKVIVEKNLSDQLVVPKNAVLIRDNLEVLFRYKNGKASWTYVHTTMANSESYSVVANADRGAELAPGDTVIISGNLNLADGSEVVLKK